jgi:hypothetical protein
MSDDSFFVRVQLNHKFQATLSLTIHIQNVLTIIVLDANIF